MRLNLDFFGKSLGLGLALVVAYYAPTWEDPKPAVQTAQSAELAVPTPASMPTDDPVVYKTGKLSGRKAGDLYAAYLGYSGNTIPETLSIDWHAQLDKLWARKTNRKRVTHVARQARRELVAEYQSKDPGRITLESYQEIAGNQAKAICTELDWQYVADRYKLGARKGALLKRVSCQMGGRVMLAYAMAELLPSYDGALNREYLDFLLRHGGRRYVESLPAVHDDITSFGPVQFTENAIFDTAKEQRGASRVNPGLPRRLRIPGSTLYLRENDHFRAAYLFGVSNLADAIRKLNPKQVATFERLAGPHGVTVAQFVAVAHNKPAVGRRALRRWLDSGGRRPFCEGCNSASRGYGKKTLNNYRALSPTRS